MSYYEDIENEIKRLKSVNFSQIQEISKTDDESKKLNLIYDSGVTTGKIKGLEKSLDILKKYRGVKIKDLHKLKVYNT